MKQWPDCRYQHFLNVAMGEGLMFGGAGWVHAASLCLVRKHPSGMCTPFCSDSQLLGYLFLADDSGERLL